MIHPQAHKEELLQKFFLRLGNVGALPNAPLRTPLGVTCKKIFNTSKASKLLDLKENNNHLQPFATT